MRSILPEVIIQLKCDHEPTPRAVQYIGAPIDRKIELTKPKGITSENPTVRVLSEPGAVNFSSLASTVNSEALDQATLDDLRDAAVGKVADGFFTGHFSDLRGAEQFMDRIGVRVEFPPEFYSDIDNLLPRLDEPTLSSLGVSQPGVVGEYNIAGARKILRSNGFTDEELGDENVAKILHYRHILMALKERGLSDGKQLKTALPKMLESGKLELTSSQDSE